MRTFVRFGGLTSAESVGLVPENGAAGFVLGRPGHPRNLDEPAVPELLDALPKGAEAWAQVRDPDAPTVRRLFDEIGVDRIEVHGKVPEGLEFLEIHHLVPALPIPLPGSGGTAPSVPPAEDFPMLCLETEGDGLADGHARAGDWDVCQRLVDEQPGRKLLVSGGVTSAGLPDLLGRARPWGVGIAAAVESAPGRYDPAKVREFLEALDRAERATTG